MSKVKTRVIPASDNGYARGWLTQKWCPDNQVWGDIGDPVDTMWAAIKKANEVEYG